jgi:hypothetical protein
MKKVVAKEIRESKWKEKEEKQAKWVIKLGFVANWVARKCAKKGARVDSL